MSSIVNPFMFRCNIFQGLSRRFTPSSSATTLTHTLVNDKSEFCCERSDVHCSGRQCIILDKICSGGGSSSAVKSIRIDR